MIRDRAALTSPTVTGFFANLNALELATPFPRHPSPSNSLQNSTLVMFSWLGSGRSSSSSNRDIENAPPDVDAADENTPLLPDVGPTSETSLQRNVHQKLHTYLILKALSQGYLPSTIQACAHLRQLLSADVLNPTNTALTPSGRKLVRDVRRLIQSIITLIETKNRNDEVQEFLWCTSRARAGFDGAEIMDAVSEAGQAGTGVNAGVEAVKTVAELLMGNREFRGLIEDVVTVARLVVSDTAEVAGEKVKDVGEVVRPDQEEIDGVGERRPAELDQKPSSDQSPEQRELMNGHGQNGAGAYKGKRPDSPSQQIKQVAAAVEEGIADTAQEAVDSAERALKDDDRGDALLERLKRTVLKLRSRADYTDSVNVISTLLKRYAIAYSRSVSGPAEHIASAVHTNSALDEAARRFWSVITSFGEKTAWDELLRRWDKLLSHLTSDVQFEALMNEIGDTITDILTDPSFADASAIDQKLQRLRQLAGGFDTGHTGSVKDDLDKLLEQAQTVLGSVANDSALTDVIAHTTAVATNLYPTPYSFNSDLASDLTHVLVPLLLQLIQYIPILRLTVATPEVDLLLENLILEPGDTVNSSSFFPHSIRLDTENAFEIRKQPRRYKSVAKSRATIILRGISVRADEVGYWLRAHTGIWRFWDEGIVSVRVDEKGVDVALDLEFARDRIENLVTLRRARVKIHKLDYVIHKSRFRWLAWPFKPFLRPILRRVLKKQMETQITEACRVLNRELVFARERLRAARVAKPKTWIRFLRAIAARMKIEDNGEVEVGVGVRTGKHERNVFEGRYAPGSVVGLWEREGEHVGEWVGVGDEGGWRNKCFDLARNDH